MIPLYLINHGLLAKPSLYLSEFFERNRASYYDALMRVRTSNDIVHWLKFFLTGVAQTASKGRDVFRQILQLRTETEQSAMNLGKRAALAQEALQLLYRRPVVDAQDLESSLNITSPTANSLIKALIEKEILVETTGQQRGRVYAFERYFSLFFS